MGSENVTAQERAAVVSQLARDDDGPEALDRCAHRRDSVRGPRDNVTLAVRACPTGYLRLPIGRVGVEPEHAIRPERLFDREIDLGRRNLPAAPGDAFGTLPSVEDRDQRLV